MKTDCLMSGAFQTNCYIVRADEASKECLIIDTALEAEELIHFLTEHELNPAAVLLTHGHIDHIGGLNLLRERYPDTKVYVHKLDAEMLAGAESNLWVLMAKPFSTAPADFLVDAGDTIDVAGIRFSVLHTPGHTPGGICLYAPEHGVVFSGDTLFAESIGRTDFPGGDMSQLLAGIRENLFSLPEDTKVYPGHGPSTTIAHEEEYNPFLR